MHIIVVSPNVVVRSVLVQNQRPRGCEVYAT